MLKDFRNLKPFYFWGERPWSQWTSTDNQFVHNKKVQVFGGNKGYVTHTYAFSSTEQWMMWQKAFLMGDHDTANAILDSYDPREIKALGRKVKNFNQALWDANKLNIVYAGNMLKFSQNEKWANELKQVVLDGYFFVEASPYDKVWGIGLNVNDAKAGIPWKGENLLGIAMTNVAIQLIKQDLMTIYQDDINSLAVTAVNAVQKEIKSFGVDTTNFVNELILEDDFHDVCVEFFEKHYGIGTYRNQN